MSAKERDVVRRNSKWKESVAGLGGLSRPVDILPVFFFCCCVYTLCIFGMTASFQTRVFVSEGRCSSLLKVVRGAIELVGRSLLLGFFQATDSPAVVAL